MSTHSYIGVIEEDGTLKYVYCHSDGYPSYLGRMLLTYYNTPELATGLVNLGDLSMVRSMLRERLVPDKGKYHTFKKPVREGPKSGITTAYHRDRKERLHINNAIITNQGQRDTLDFDADDSSVSYDVADIVYSAIKRNGRVIESFTEASNN